MESRRKIIRHDFVGLWATTYFVPLDLVNRKMCMQLEHHNSYSTPSKVTKRKEGLLQFWNTALYERLHCH